MLTSVLEFYSCVGNRFSVPYVEQFAWRKYIPNSKEGPTNIKKKTTMGRYPLIRGNTHPHSWYFHSTRISLRGATPGFSIALHSPFLLGVSSPQPRRGGESAPSGVQFRSLFILPLSCVLQFRFGQQGKWHFISPSACSYFIFQFLEHLVRKKVLFIGFS